MWFKESLERIQDGPDPGRLQALAQNSFWLLKMYEKRYITTFESERWFHQRTPAIDLHFGSSSLTLILLCSIRIFGKLHQLFLVTSFYFSFSLFFLRFLTK